MTLSAITESTRVTIGLVGGVIVVVGAGMFQLGRMSTTVENGQRADVAHEERLARHDQTLGDHETRLKVQESVPPRFSGIRERSILAKTELLPTPPEPSDAER